MLPIDRLIIISMPGEKPEVSFFPPLGKEAEASRMRFAAEREKRAWLQCQPEAIQREMSREDLLARMHPSQVRSHLASWLRAWRAAKRERIKRQKACLN